MVVPVSPTIDPNQIKGAIDILKDGAATVKGLFDSIPRDVTEAKVNGVIFEITTNILLVGALAGAAVIAMKFKPKPKEYWGIGEIPEPEGKFASDYTAIEAVYINNGDPDIFDGWDKIKLADGDDGCIVVSGCDKDNYNGDYWPPRGTNMLNGKACYERYDNGNSFMLMWFCAPIDERTYWGITEEFNEPDKPRVINNGNTDVFSGWDRAGLRESGDGGSFIEVTGLSDDLAKYNGMYFPKYPVSGSWYIVMQGNVSRSFKNTKGDTIEDANQCPVLGGWPDNIVVSRTVSNLWDRLTVSGAVDLPINQVYNLDTESPKPRWRCSDAASTYFIEFKEDGSYGGLDGKPAWAQDAEEETYLIRWFDSSIAEGSPDAPLDDDKSGEGGIVPIWEEAPTDPRWEMVSGISEWEPASMATEWVTENGNRNYTSNILERFTFYQYMQSSTWDSGLYVKIKSKNAWAQNYLGKILVKFHCPEILYDRTGIGGNTGRFITFTAYLCRYKDADQVATYVYDRQDKTVEIPQNDYTNYLDGKEVFIELDFSKELQGTPTAVFPGPIVLYLYMLKDKNNGKSTYVEITNVYYYAEAPLEDNYKR